MYFHWENICYKYIQGIYSFCDMSIDRIKHFTTSWLCGVEKLIRIQKISGNSKTMILDSEKQSYWIINHPEAYLINEIKFGLVDKLWCKRRHRHESLFSNRATRPSFVSNDRLLSNRIESKKRIDKFGRLSIIQLEKPVQKDCVINQPFN